MTNTTVPEYKQNANAPLGVLIPKDGLVVVTYSNNAPHILLAKSFEDILIDNNPEAKDFIPDNNAPVLFAAYNNKPINPRCYDSFASFVAYMQQRPAQ